MVMKLDIFFVFGFCPMFWPDHAQATPFSKKTANQKFRLIYPKLSCEPRTKDCAWSRSS